MRSTAKGTVQLEREFLRKEGSRETRHHQGSRGRFRTAAVRHRRGRTSQITRGNHAAFRGKAGQTSQQKEEG